MEGCRQWICSVDFGFLSQRVWIHSRSITITQNTGAPDFPENEAKKENKKGRNRNSQEISTNHWVRGTLYFYKTITKYSKIHFSKFTAVISQFINAKTSFFLCTNYRLHPRGLTTMCAFKKYYFLINSLKLKITEFFQFVKKKSVYVCVNSLGFQEHDQSGRYKANTNHEGSTEDSCYIGK